MATPTDAAYRDVFGDPPVRLDPECGLNLPDVPNIDVGGPPTSSLSPLVEFQYALTTLLVRELASQLGNSTLVDGQLTDALLNAVQTVTGQHWRVERINTLIQDANGVVRDGVSFGGAIAPSPVTALYGLKVAARYARPFTEDEQRACDQRYAALVWSAGGGSTPPPAGVNTLALLEQDEWWKPEKADAIRLVDMAVTHRANLLDWLYRRARQFHEREISEFTTMLSGPMGPGGDMAIDGAEREYDRLCEQDAVAWMGEQPLVRQLTRLLRRAEVRPVCRSCHRRWTRKMRGTADCTSTSNRHGPWVLAAALTLGMDADGSTESTVSGERPTGRMPTNDDIDHGVRVRVLPGPRHGTPGIARNHGTGHVTWITKGIDPARTRFGVAIDHGGTSEAGLADVELLDDASPAEGASIESDAPMALTVTDGGDGGPGMRDINAAFDRYAPEDDPTDERGGQ